MRRRWIGAVAVCCLALAGCGGSGADAGAGPSSPLNQEVARCFRQAGGKAGVLDGDSRPENVVVAQAVNGDLIFIVDLPRPDLAELTAGAFRKRMHQEGRDGIMTTSSVHRGSTLILVAGQAGIAGGLPAMASEELARNCATGRGPGDAAKPLGAPA